MPDFAEYGCFKGFESDLTLDVYTWLFQSQKVIPFFPYFADRLKYEERGQSVKMGHVENFPSLDSLLHFPPSHGSVPWMV